METIREALRHPNQDCVSRLHHDNLFGTGRDTVCLSPQDAETDEGWAQVLESNEIRFTKYEERNSKSNYKPLEQAVLKLLRDPVFRKARVVVSRTPYSTNMAAVFFSFPYASAEISWTSDAYESSDLKYLTIESPFVLNERSPEYIRVIKTDKNFIKAAREVIRPLTIEDIVRHVGKLANRQIEDIEREVRQARKSLENEIRSDESLLSALGRVDKHGQVSLDGGLISKIRALNEFDADRKEVGKGRLGNTTCAVYCTHTFSDETIFHTVLLSEVDWSTSVKVSEPTTYTTSTLPEEVSRKISTVQVYGEDVEGVGITIKPSGIYYIFL